MIPQVGMYRSENHQYWWNGDGPLPSVTTAMKLYDKSNALVGWAKRETASFAVRHLDILTAHREHTARDPLCPPCIAAGRPFGPTESAVKWVSSIPDYQSDAARDLGSEVHAIAEAIGKDEQPDVPESFLPYARGYRRFIEEVQPEFLAIEYMGVNRKHGYAGTGDFMARIGGFVTCVDIKTHTKPTPLPDTYYPETAMQLAACAGLEFIGKPADPTEYPVPRAERFGVLLLGPETYRLIPYFVTKETFEAFLACLRLYRWQQGEARVIVGQPAKEAA